jgi:hypothetical protein
VHDEATQHDKRRDVVQHVADRNRTAAERMREPQRNTGDEKQRGRGDNHPEVQFLSTVEESDVFRLEAMGVGDITSDATQPAAILRTPSHRLVPIENLQHEEHDEDETEPRMQQPRHRSSTK